MILHLGHFQSRAIASHFNKYHLIENEIANNGCAWIHWNSFPQIEMLLFLVVEILVVAVDYAEFERLNARMRKAARFIL